MTNETREKATPGPWHVEKHMRTLPYEASGPGGSYEGRSYEYLLVVHEDNEQPQLRTPIAEIAPSTEAAANAKLIAAAPALRDALRKLSEEFPVPETEPEARAVREARELLASLEGAL